MKKQEAKELASQRSNLVFEYINQIFSDEIKIKGNMKFTDVRIDGQNYCVLDIYVPERNFEKHLNLGITVDHVDVLYEQIFTDLFNVFISGNIFFVSKYYNNPPTMLSFKRPVNGVFLQNQHGSEIFLSFNRLSNYIIDNYNQKITELMSENNLEEIDEKHL